jgi:hypothetical protein
MGNSEKESLAGKQIEREIIVRREAQLEVQDGFHYYQEKSVGLGFEFMRSLDAALQPAKRNPSHTKKFIKKRGAFYYANFLTRFFTLLRRTA